MSAATPPTLEQRIAALEAKAKTEFESWWTWIKTNIVHIAGYASVVAAIKKLF